MLWCWVNFKCWGVQLIWIIVGQGPTALAVCVPTALAVCVGGGCLDIFFQSFISLLPLSGRQPNID